MKLSYLAVASAFALAACGQAEAPKQDASTAAQSLMDQAAAMGAEQLPVFGYQQLVAYQQAHPESQPPCTAPRSTESRGVIPANVAPDSLYAPYAGALVVSVQCGVLRSRAVFDPAEHWLVVFAPGATEATVVSCANERGTDSCPAEVPLATAAPAAPAPATP